jgi:hypothetical protein
MIKINFNLSFDYGAYSIKFNKKFEMPAAPTMGTCLYDHNDNNDCLLEYETNQYQRCMIYYDTVEQIYHIDLHKKYPKTVSEDAIDSDLKCYSDLGWTLEKDDSKSIKDLSKRAWEREQQS